MKQSHGHADLFSTFKLDSVLKHKCYIIPRNIIIFKFILYIYDARILSSSKVAVSHFEQICSLNQKNRGRAIILANGSKMKHDSRHA